jgi:hypothetical protein
MRDAMVSLPPVLFNLCHENSTVDVRVVRIFPMHSCKKEARL